MGFWTIASISFLQGALAGVPLAYSKRVEREKNNGTTVRMVFTNNRSHGEHISPVPVPKIYEASHGMCQTCGNSWLAAVEESYGGGGVMSVSENGGHHVQCMEESALHR